MKIPYEPPKYGKDAFNCPHTNCSAHAKMEWYYRTHILSGNLDKQRCSDVGVASAQCARCNNTSIWVKGVMIYPKINTAIPPNPEMPEAALALYKEAAEIHSLSPRSAGALLRLSVETLVNKMKPGTGNLNDKIGLLVEDGLHPKIQQALDSVRVIGNNAVHPGEIDADDPETVAVLFGLVNLIVEETIEKPKHVEKIFGMLPDGAKEGIERRDSKKKEDPPS